MPAPAAVSPAPSLWRPGPLRLGRLLAGLWLFGAGDALVLHSELGNSPWTVFAEGVSKHTPLSVGAATVAASFVILLASVPLGVRPGLGTLLNAALVGVAIDATISLVGETPGALGLRAAEVLVGIALVGAGSGLYINAALGPGPRDGLMLGLHRRTGRPVALVRAAIELSALTAGALLGGTLGPGTVAFALLIGPAVAAGLRLIPARRPT